MAKVECSELSKQVTELALLVAEDPDVKNLDDVVARINTMDGLQMLSRTDVVNAIVEATTGKQEAMTDLQKKLAEIKREARIDRETRDKINNIAQHIKNETAPPSDYKPRKAAPEAIEKLRSERDRLRRELKQTKAARLQEAKTRAPAQAGDLVRRINELSKHIREGTTPPKFRSTAPKGTPLVEELRALRDDLRKQLRQTPAARKQAAKDRQPKRAAELSAKIDELTKHIEAGTLPPPSVRPENVETPLVKELQELRDDLKRSLNKSPEAQKKRILESIAELERRLDEHDYAPTVREELPTTRELEKLRFQQRRLRHQLNQQVNEMKTTKGKRILRELTDTPRALVASIDISAVGRQGQFVLISHPLRAAKAMIPMARAIVSSQNEQASYDAIMDRPNAPLYSRAGLYIAPINSDAKITQREEVFRSTVAEKIPIYGHLIKASERAYVTFLNQIRADSFDAMAATLSRTGEPTKVEAEAIANFVNIATGRGAAPAGEIGHHLLFSQRWTASRLQLVYGAAANPIGAVLGPQETRRVKRLITKEYAKYLIGLGVLYGLLELFGFEVEKDPRSSDFLKIRIGDTRLDPMGGTSQSIVYFARVASGEIKSSTTGRITPIRGDGFMFRDFSDVTADTWFWYKLNPTASTVRNLASGQNVVGEKRDLTSVEGAMGVAADLTIPLSVREVYETLREQGVAKGSAMALLNMLGVGVSTYSDRN